MAPVYARARLRVFYLRDTARWPRPLEVKQRMETQTSGCASGSVRKVLR